jgi:hypothetical protein
MSFSYPLSEVRAMMRQKNILWCARSLMSIALASAAGFAAQLATAQGLRYQDADELTIDPALGRPNVQPMSAFRSFEPVVDNDNLWNFRNFGVAPTTLKSVFQSGIAEDSPMLTQTLTGLMPLQSYDLYAVYWTDVDENWTIRTGTSPGSLIFYSWTGPSGASPVAGSTQGIAASTAVWAVPPPPTKEGTIFIERAADTVQHPLVMILGKAGTATANASGQIDVFVDDNPLAGGVRRTWYDGVAYVEAGPNSANIAATATLDRMTGTLTLNNPTTQNLQIKSYRIESPTTGALNATTWSRISSGNPSWTTTMPADPPNTPFTNVLSEDGGGSTVTVASGGGSHSFGNVWNKSPFDHVLVYLTLADDSLAVLAAHYAGPAIVNGDLDANGVINLSDFQTLLNNLHVPLPTPQLSRVETYRRGELTNDNVINFSDWVAFRAAYNAANGAGSFEALLAQIPEPSSLAMLCVAGAGALIYRRRRAASMCLAVMTVLLLAGTSSAVTFLKVDVNARAGEPTPPAPPGDNTVSGFSPYTMQTGTTGGLGTSSGTVNGFTITLTAVNPDGVPTGVFDDRDRATPTTAPTLNQLYDDFIFANQGTTGDGGGLDMVINSSGGLMPNTQYAVSLYSFDTGSTGLRTANWLDGNSANAVVITTAFDGANSPTSDNQYRFNGIFRTDGSGNLLLRARETAAASHGVFLNGFEISDELPPPPVELTLRVNTTTGSVTIGNQQTVNLDMSYYEIRSATGALNLAGWTSLDDAEAGDPVGAGWDEAPASNANLLSEVNLQSMTSISPGNSVSLGNAFTPGGAQNLQFFYAGPEETALRVGIISYVTGPDALPGDFNEDGKVDAADYVVWRKTDGSQAGYNDWRTNFGRTAGSGAGLAATAAVPEPSSASLGAFGMALWITALRRKLADA